MKRKTVMKVLCISIVSSMLVTSSMLFVKASDTQRTVVYHGVQTTVTVSEDQILFPDGTVIPLSEFTGQFIDTPDAAAEPEKASQPDKTENLTEPDTKPQDPTKPEAVPEEPEEPANPETKPKEPDDSDTPETKPEEPKDPSTPETEPTEPEDPDTPGTEPTEPKDPATPETEPESPDTAGTEPTEPESPDTSGTKPTQPEAPDTAGDPETDSAEETQPLKPTVPTDVLTETEKESVLDSQETPVEQLTGKKESAGHEGNAFFGTPAVTAGLDFYINELEEDYHITFDKDFASVTAKIEAEFIDKILAKYRAQEDAKITADLGIDPAVAAETETADEADAEEDKETEETAEDAADAELLKALAERGEKLEKLDAAIKTMDRSVQFSNWQDVLAVYLLKEACAGRDTYVMNGSDAEELSAVFAQMNTGTVKDGQITVTSETIADYEKKHSGTLDADSVKFLEKYTSPNCTLLCAAATGIEGFITESLGEGVSEERAKVVAAAYSLVGKVSYFWGGKSSVIGLDPRWGSARTVTAAGSRSSGSVRQYGLDCSGYVTWAFINGYQDVHAAALVGQGTMSQWGKSTEITEEEALPGDLVFLEVPNGLSINHVGIVVGRNDDGKLVAAHCSSGDNGVVVESAYKAGFRYIRRPSVYK